MAKCRRWSTVTKRRHGLGADLHFLTLAKMVKETAVLTACSARITDRPAYRKMMETDKR
jgi:hypothetical protein